MSKATKARNTEDMRAEYDFTKLRRVGPRGPYAARYAQGTVVLPHERRLLSRLGHRLVAGFFHVTHRHSSSH